MADHQVWAYSVRPARGGAAVGTTAVGGRVAESAALRGALDAAAGRTSAGDWTDVVFRVEPLNDERGVRRSCRARDAALDLAFGDAAIQDSAADQLAARLGAAMDNRSQPHLLVLASTVDDRRVVRAVTMWTFPRDDAIRFEASARPRVEILENVFSQTSRLRKAAKFSGERHDADFLDGQVLDFQTGRTSIDVADYWVRDFLQCALAVTSIQGTENVAGAIQKLNASLDNAADRERLNIAVLALRNSPRPSWTVDEIAEFFLPEDLGVRLRANSDPNMVTARFEINHDSYDRLLTTRVFSLESGVVVSSPISQVGGPNQRTSVVVSGDQLSCQGRIVKERLSGRRGGRPASSGIRAAGPAA